MQVGDGLGRAGELGQLRGRGEARGSAFLDLAGRVPLRAPADDRLQRQRGRLADQDDCAASRADDQGRRVEPAPDRLLRRTQIRTGEHQPGVEQQRRAVAAFGDRLGSGCADDQRRLVRHDVEHVVAPRRTHDHAGKRPPQLLRRTTGSDDRGAHPGVAALRAAVIRRRPAAHAAARRPGSTGTTQRPAARRAPRRRPAGLAHQARQIPGPRHLHQHRPRPQPLTRDLERPMRQPRRPSRRIAGQIRVRLPRDVHRRSRRPDHRPVRDQLVRRTRTPPARPPPPTARTHRAAPHTSAGTPAAARLPGHAGTARAARRTSRRRRPTTRPARDPPPARTRPPASRSPPAHTRAAPRGTPGSEPSARGPPTA